MELWIYVTVILVYFYIFFRTHYKCNVPILPVWYDGQTIVHFTHLYCIKMSEVFINIIHLE